MTARVATLGAVLASALLVSCPMAERASSGAIRAGSPSPAPGQAVGQPAVPPPGARRRPVVHPVFVLQPTVQQLERLRARQLARADAR